MTQLTCSKRMIFAENSAPNYNEDIAYNIGRAYGQIYQPKKVVIGCDPFE